MRTIFKTIVAVIALTVTQLGYAETEQPLIMAEAQPNTETATVDFPIVQLKTFSTKDADCLARNIYHEAANEPEEGKVAVGVVTLNRSMDQRFPGSICGVVNQRTTLDRIRTATKKVKTLLSTRVEQQRVVEKVTICQFSWKCEKVKLPKASDARWEDSQRIAQELLQGGYEHYRVKYQDAIYFHATRIKPVWSKQKQKVNRIGGHIFYADK